MNSVVTNDQKEKAEFVKRMYSIYQENKDLVLMGGYSKGQNEEIDIAMESWPKICELLKQDYKTKSDFSDCLKKLDKIILK